MPRHNTSMISLPNKQQRGKLLEGIVVSDRMQKTVVVRVDRRVKHPRYRKYITTSKHHKAHHEENHIRVGDRVIIQETRPLSKTKRWKVVRHVSPTRKNGAIREQTAVPSAHTTAI